MEGNHQDGGDKVDNTQVEDEHVELGLQLLVGQIRDDGEQISQRSDDNHEDADHYSEIPSKKKVIISE